MDRKLKLVRFDWRKDGEKKQFCDIVEGICVSLRKSFKVPNAVSADQFRWYVACAGRLGVLVKIVRRAIKLARKGKRNEIDFKLLHDAWARSTFDVGATSDAQHPFGVKSDIAADELTIKRILAIGVESNEHQSPKARKSAKGKDVRVSAKAAKRAVRDALAA
jgi:hypothetical protein